jgi:hypothetical protein
VKGTCFAEFIAMVDSLRQNLALVFCLVFATPASAVPFLQLDIAGGEYIGGLDETVYSTTDPFTLYALVDSTNDKYIAGQTYYLSAAIVPKQSAGASPADFGSFTISPIGGAFSSASGWVFGVPPIADPARNPEGNLGDHGIFDTYYREFAFTTLPGTATEYNSQDNPGGAVDNPLGSLLYQSFLIDTTGMADGYALHFDLYTVGADNRLDEKAPFSHDAQSNDVPDNGGTLVLLGLACGGIAGIRRLLPERKVAEVAVGN